MLFDASQKLTWPLEGSLLPHGWATLIVPNGRPWLPRLSPEASPGTPGGLGFQYFSLSGTPEGLGFQYCPLRLPLELLDKKM